MSMSRLISHRHAVRRFVSDGQPRPSTRFFGASPTTRTIEAWRDKQSLHSVGRDVDTAERCSFFAHRFLLLYFTASYNTQNELTNCISASKTPLKRLHFCDTSPACRRCRCPFCPKMQVLFLPRCRHSSCQKQGMKLESLQERIMYDG